MSHRFHPVAVATSLLIASTLVACGGGGSTEVSTATPLTLSGVVVGNGFIKNAVVCLDLNANAACDADEPAAAKTGADGAYSISVDTAKVTEAQVAAASLIAPQVPGTVDDGKATIDMASPTATNTTSAYVLRQVAGKSGQINPLTTLVAAGVASGMTEAVARANVAIQLGVSAEKIDDYQADAPTSEASLPESARTAAQVVISALAAGVPLKVGDQMAAVEAAQSSLRSLTYTDASNFNYLDFLQLAKPAGTAGLSATDHRVAMVNGVAANIYRQAFLSAQGWTPCDASVPISTATGTPARSVFCNARVSYGFSAETPVDGQTMADVVTQMQSLTGNTINAGVSTTNLLAALGSAKFPEGSKRLESQSLNVTQPLYINNINTDAQVSSSVTTLEQLIAARPTSGVALPGTGGTLGLGLGSGEFKNLRVAFASTIDASSGTVQFYECDLDAAQAVASNCAATQTGTYAIETINGVRAIRFAGHAETVMSQTRLFAEVKLSQQTRAFTATDRVYVVRQDKPGRTANASAPSARINGAAWVAMKTQLGL